MKKIVFYSFFFFTFYCQAQTYVKANVVTAFALIPNVGIETSIGKKLTFQSDVTASFWKSFMGQKFEFYTLNNEFKYHFKEKYNGFYTGLDAGLDRYKMQKWNYWNSNNYQDGFGYRFGMSIGWNFKLSSRFVADLHFGAGWHQGFYHGYYKDGTPGRYENVKNWNKSGEWLPFRGGIMLAYRL